MVGGSPDPWCAWPVSGFVDDLMRDILERSRTVAVLGIHRDAGRPAHYVPAYLHQQGYRVLGVNPKLAGQELFGVRVVARLAELLEPVDVVDVFRRSELLAMHLPELLAMSPRPRAVWLQQGVRDDPFARALREAEIDVVQDRCTLREHRRLGLTRAH